MKIRMTESDNPFNQNFPTATPIEEDGYRKEAFDLLLKKLSTIVNDPELSEQWENEVCVIGVVDVSGTAERADYEDDSVTGGYEGVEVNIDVDDLTEKAEAIVKEVNEALESAGNPIRFFNPSVDDTGDYEIEDVDDYDIEEGDDGIGSYEFWGTKGYDSRPYKDAVNISWSGWADISIDLEYRKIR